ncbi:MAG TPA: enoyl-CoA hydratase [Lichenihabitans sp.]|jgi:enoyl-CoA hydratase/carnithine racemase|nr:enoyl-CoA hydratase [Lichenihabitans sp.]
MDTRETAPVLLRRNEDGVTTLTLNRPAQYNALSEALLGALQGELDDLASDENLRCVILAAEGKAFSAGHDLKQMRARPEEAYYKDLFSRCGRVMQSIRALPVPVIAAVQGVATAAGCQLVATCDLAVAARAARFAVSGINVGLFCSTPAVALSRNIPPKTAFDMLMTGRFIDAETALAKGLVNAVVDDAALGDAVQAYAAEIASKSPAAVRLGKALFYKQAAMGLAEAYAYTGDAMACNMMEEDARAGIDAFIGKKG